MNCYRVELTQNKVKRTSATSGAVLNVAGDITDVTAALPLTLGAQGFCLYIFGDF